MSASLLPLLCVLVGWSAALPGATMGHTEELDLTPHVIFNQIALQQLQEEQRGVEDGVKSMLMMMANLTDVVSTHLTLDDRYMQGVKERENATRRLLGTLDQLECVNKAHQADNLKLKEENTRLNTTIHLLEEDNRKTKNEVRLAQEEIIQLKSQIRQVEEDARLVKEEIILVEEENRKTRNDVRLSQEEERLVRAELRQVEEDARLVKEKIRVLEFAETQAQDSNNAASIRIVELEREIQLLQETNNMTEGEKRQVEDQLLLLEEQVMVLQTAIAALEEDKEGQAEKINRMENEKNRTEDKSRLMAEEHQECKRNVSELSARLLPARDCAELYCKGARQDGVYLIYHSREVRLVSAWCDMTTDGGGWTVFVKRDIRVVPAVNFARDWEAYKTGFGNAATEYWLGTEAVHQLTQHSPQTLRVAATNRYMQDDHRWALWSTFSVAGESTGYQLLVDGYQEESTMGDVLVRHRNFSGLKFSTLDRDNDLRSNASCAQLVSYQGGWWYSDCSSIGTTSPHGYLSTLYWTPGVEGNWEGFLQLQMMIRPQNFPTCHL